MGLLADYFSNIIIKQFACFPHLIYAKKIRNIHTFFELQKLEFFKWKRFDGTQ